MAALTSAESTTVFVKCSNPTEPHLVEKLLAWFESNQTLACPFCGAVVDLQHGENRLRVDEMLKACANLDALLSK